METQKVHLTKEMEKETLLVTFYAKALDSRTKNSILGDKFAGEVVRHIDYDFEKLKIPKGTSISVPTRAKHLDLWTSEFLAANPNSTVLHLGCGLDSRVFRIDPPASVRWYDVDYPEVIELRRHLYPDRHDYYMIGSSVTDLRWLDEIPADRQVLVVAEGLVAFLSEKEGIELFKRITERFPGGQFIFDAYSWLTVQLIKRFFGASLTWGIDDPRDLERYIPRLKLITEVSFLNMPELVARLSWHQRTMCRITGHITFLRRGVQHLRYGFKRK